MKITNENAEIIAKNLIAGHLGAMSVDFDNENSYSSFELSLSGIADDSSFLAFHFNSDSLPRDAIDFGLSHNIKEDGEWQSETHTDGDGDEYEEDTYDGTLTSLFGLTNLDINLSMSSYCDESCDAFGEGYLYIFKDEAALNKYIDTFQPLNFIQRDFEFECDLSIVPSNTKGIKHNDIRNHASMAELLSINFEQHPVEFTEALKTLKLESDFNPYAAKANGESFLDMITKIVNNKQFCREHERSMQYAATHLFPIAAPLSENQLTEIETIIKLRVQGDNVNKGNVSNLLDDLPVNANTVYNNGRNLLHLIAESTLYTCGLEILLEPNNPFNINPSFVDNDGNSPIHSLCKHNKNLKMAFFKELANANVDLSGINYAGKTALDLAIENINDTEADIMKYQNIDLNDMKAFVDALSKQTSADIAMKEANKTVDGTTMRGSNKAI